MSEPEIVQLPNIAAEYWYIKRLNCEHCGESVKGTRRSARPSEDNRMHDLWELNCPRCHTSKNIVLSVPVLDILGMLDSKNK